MAITLSLESVNLDYFRLICLSDSLKVRRSGERVRDPVCGEERFSEFRESQLIFFFNLRIITLVE